MRKYAGVIYLLGALAVLASGCALIRVGFQDQVEATTALDLVLQKMYLERQDLSIKHEIKPRDPFLLNKVSHFLRSPVQTIYFSRNVETKLYKKHQSMSALITFCADMLEIKAGEVDLPEAPQELSAPGINDFAGNIYSSLVYAKSIFEEAFSELGKDEADFVRGKIEQLLFYGKHREDLTRKENQDLIEKAFRLASRIDAGKIGEAGYVIASALDDIIPKLKNTYLPSGNVRRFSTKLGDVIIGSNGNDTYEGKMPIILIDPGGDDTYSFRDHARFSVIVDVSGDDTYESSDSCFLASGIMGLGFLIDIEGDDIYKGKNFSFGCGFMGAGVLADLSGDDRYVSEMFCQGAATIGMGLLYDAGGDDYYESALYSQGFGYVGGAGLLADIDGDDSFVISKGVPDSREKTGAFQNYSQGFGLGCRLFASGGVGILYNGAGNDTYKGSYFCQGSGYWHAMGMLIDTKGDDRYESRRYSQGTGVHSSIGVLLDGQGDDFYEAWGVSQGCGHDLSVGILQDRGGDDLYVAEWLSQGAGNSMGIGMLVDDKGDDTYKTGSVDSTQGSGIYDNRRDAESIGILVDAEGEDHFSGDPLGAEIWRREDVGGGIDNNGDLGSVWYEPPKVFFGNDPKGSYQTRQNMGPESWGKLILPELEAPLFLEDSWDRAAESLAVKGADIIPALLKYLEIKDIAIKRTIENTFKKIAEKHLEDIHYFLQRTETQTRQKVFLLFVLGDIQNVESRGVFLRLLSHESSSVQAMALRGLYKLQISPPIKQLRSFFSSADSAVRKYLCLVLQASDDAGALQLVCDLLTDDDFQVRHAAYKVLKEKKEAALPFLEGLQAKPGLAPSVYRMADDIKEYCKIKVK